MKIIELQKNKYFIRIERDEKVMEQLGKFADQYLKTSNGYRFASLSNGLGGGMKDSEGYFSQVGAITKAYPEASELLNITGNITNRKGTNDKFIHIHATFGKTEKDNHQAWGFHLNDSTVGLTIEMILDAYDVVINREADWEGLPLVLSSAETVVEGSSKEELERLREENKRLKIENERLKNALEASNKTNQAINASNQTLIAQVLQKPRE